MTAEPCVAIDLTQLTMNFDWRYTLCIQSFMTYRTSQSPVAEITASIFNRCSDATVRTREVPLVHVLCDIITLSLGLGSSGKFFFFYFMSEDEAQHNTPCPGQKLPIRNFSNLRTNADMKIKFMANERAPFQVLCMMLATFSHCC